MSTTKPLPHIRLTATDKHRIELAKSLGVFTLEAFRILAGISKGAAKAWLYRFTGRGPRYRYFFPVKLADGRTLYHFTTLGCRLFDVPRHFAKPLGPQARVERVAALDFIYSDANRNREYRFAKDIRADLQISDRYLARNYYIEVQSDVVYVGVIFAGTGSAEERVASVLRFIQKAFSYEKLLDLMKDPRKPLALTVLVRNAAHQKKIRNLLPKAIMNEFATTFAKVLEKEVEAPPFTLIIEVLPQLCPLITALETQRSQRRS